MKKKLKPKTSLGRRRGVIFTTPLYNLGYIVQINDKCILFVRFYM